MLATFEAKKNARKAIGAALISGAVTGPSSSRKNKKGMQLRVYKKVSIKGFVISLSLWSMTIYLR